MPGLSSFVKSLKTYPADHAVESLTILLKRRQVCGSRSCAVAVTHLFLRLVAESKHKTIPQLMERVRAVGRRLVDAQPRELVVGNIVRRVLGLVREVSEGPTDTDMIVGQNITTQPINSASNPNSSSITPNGVVGVEFSIPTEPPSMREIKEDMLNGLREMLDELDQADEQIAGYSLEHIHAEEVILTYTSSLTVQKFLLTAAKRRKFSVIYVEGFPNLHKTTHSTILNGHRQDDNYEKSGDKRLKSLITAGINVTIIPDCAIFAVMSRVNKVILPVHVMLSNGGFIAASGTDVIARAAKVHRVPIITLAAVYKHSPTYPFEVEAFTGSGDSGKPTNYTGGQFAGEIDVINPLYDYVEPDLADLVISNIGAFSPSFVYQIIADHYRGNDLDLSITRSSA